MHLIGFYQATCFVDVTHTSKIFSFGEFEISYGIASMTQVRKAYNISA
jgi:hypothetical protein